MEEYDASLGAAAAGNARLLAELQSALTFTDAEIAAELAASDGLEPPTASPSQTPQTAQPRAAASSLILPTAPAAAPGRSGRSGRARAPARGGAAVPPPQAPPRYDASGEAIPISRD